MHDYPENKDSEFRLSVALPKKASVWLGFGAAFVAAIAGLIYINTHTSDEQRNLAATLTVRTLNACVLIGIIGFALVSSRLSALLPRRNIVTAIAFCVAGFLLCGLAPKTNRIFFDEHIYMQIGQSIAHTGRAEAANYARAEYGAFEMYSGWVNKQPNGHPYVLSWLYRITGVSSDVSFFVNRAWVGIAAAALYLALTLIPWNLPRGTPAWTAGLYCLTPLVLWWGHTVAVEPGASGSAAVAFFAVCMFARLYNFAEPRREPVTSGLFLSATLAFACYFRPESLLVFPMALSVLWATNRRFLTDFNTLAALALAFALTVPELMHLWSVHTEDWGARDGRRFAADFLPANLASNAGYFVNGKWFPIAGTLLGLAGLYYLFRSRIETAVALFVWIGMSWGIFVLFYAGGYHYGASSRYGVVSCAPIAVAMGVGAASLWARFAQRRGLLALIFGFVGLNWISAMHYVPTISRESAEARADVDFVHRVAPTLPEGCLVISSNPCMWTVEGRNSSQFFTIESMVRTQLIELKNQYPGGIFIHWNFWHNVEPAMAEDARALIKDTGAEIIASATSQDHEIAILRADTKTALAKFGGTGHPNNHIQRMTTTVDAVQKTSAAAITP